MRVLALEPFWGGSHRRFIEGWSRHSDHDWQTLTLPAAKWKWRMRQSAPLFATEAERRWSRGEHWDVVLASDMVDLASFRGLLTGPAGEVPMVLYFHENQITYPVRFAADRDYHFGLTNLISASVADAVWFNSEFHRRDLLAAAPEFLRKMPRPRPMELVDRLAEKATVESPGIDPPPVAASGESSGPCRILWSSRWEHDKDPETFFEALHQLKGTGVEFELSVLGERCQEAPEAFAEAEVSFREQIVHWGYLESRSAYWQALAEADVFVSTADHEFFGLSAVEAIASGARPLLPKRLSYPELLDLEEEPRLAPCYWEGGAAELAKSLIEVAEGGARRVPDTAARVERFHWQQRAPRMDAALESLLSTSSLAGA